MNETEKMFELTQKTYDLVEGIFGSYSSLNKLYENSIKDYDEQNNRLKEAFENAQKNLEEIQKIKEGTTAETNKIEAILKDQSLITQSVGQIQKSIDDFNAQTAINEKDMNDVKAEIFAKKKETIDFINKKLEEIQDQKNQISKLLESVPKDDSVTIEGTEATVVHNGNIIHYKFPTGTNLENVDFIDEKADNGVDTLLGEKLEELSTLSMKNGFNLTDTIKQEDKFRNLYISSSDGLKIGEISSFKNEKGENETLEAFLLVDEGHLILENGDSNASLTTQGLDLKHQTSELAISKGGGIYAITDNITSVINLKAKNTAANQESSLTVDPGYIEFYCDNGLYLNSKNTQGEVERKKILIEGDVDRANSNQKFFLEEGAERRVPLDGHYEEADKIYLDTNLNPYGLNPYGYPFLNDKESYYFLSPQLWEKKIGNSVSTIDFVSTNGIRIITREDSGSGSGTDSGKFVYHSIGMGDPDQPLMLSCTVDKDSYFTSGINIQYGKTNRNRINIDNERISIESERDFTTDYSSISISPELIDIRSANFIYNGREVLFN